MVNFGNPSKGRVTIRSYYSLHKASRKPIIVGEPCRWQLLPGRFFGDLHSDRRAHQQECLPPIYLPVEASSENSITRAHTRRSPVRRMNCNTVLHAPPPASASAADKPIHPLHAPHHRLKSPSFSVFLSGHCYCVFLSPESPLFLCFLELYDIFRTLGVVSVDSY